ncbi:MAG: hypothetical protein JRJ48_02630 [Deltaproteobacteria bacterium]|nr:hypothetical protein [Deltaproteobacteria bacterium]
MGRIEKKYRSLRVIAWFFKLGAWISLIFGFVLFFAVLFGGKIILHLVPNSPYTPYMELGQTAGAFFLLAGFLINTLILYALSSSIHLFIDIEANTRKTAQLLEASPLPSSTPTEKERTPIETSPKTS